MFEIVNTVVHCVHGERRDEKNFKKLSGVLNKKKKTNKQNKQNQNKLSSQQTWNGVTRSMAQN